MICVFFFLLLLLIEGRRNSTQLRLTPKSNKYSEFNAVFFLPKCPLNVNMHALLWLKRPRVGRVCWHVFHCLTQKKKNKTNHRPSYCPTLQDGLMWEFRLKCTWAGVVTRVPSLEDLTVEQRQLASFAVSIYSRWQFYPVLDLILSLPSFVMMRFIRSPSESFALTLLVFIPGVFCVYISVEQCAVFIFCLTFFFGGGRQFEINRNSTETRLWLSEWLQLQWECSGTVRDEEQGTDRFDLIWGLIPENI